MAARRSRSAERSVSNSGDGQKYEKISLEGSFWVVVVVMGRIEAGFRNQISMLLNAAPLKVQSFLKFDNLCAKMKKLVE